MVDAVGNTPLIRLARFEAEFENIELLAKLEFFNPGGSVKDRAALQMVREALADGTFRPGMTLVDSTSGNTGIAYSWIGAALGFPVALVMPANVSEARKRITAAYGAELIFSDPMEGSDGAIRRVRELVQARPDHFFYPDQYSNPANPRAHYLGTGPEILTQTRGRVTHFVTGIGTSGTVMGVGRCLKEFRKDIEVVAVEPLEPMHGLEGLKHMPTSLVPAIYAPGNLDEVLSVSTDEGWEVAERLAQEEGLFVGHSAGASLAGALSLARRLAVRGAPGVIVTLFPDRADRYFEAPTWKRRFAW